MHRGLALSTMRAALLWPLTTKWPALFAPDHVEVAQPQATLVAVLPSHGPAVLRAERTKSVFLSGIAAALSCPAAAARAARSGHRLPGHDRSRQLKKNFRRGWFWLIQASLTASDSTGPSPKQKGGAADPAP